MNKIEENMWVNLNKIHSNFSKVFDIAVNGEGVTKAQALILLFVYREKDINVNKLSLELDLNQGNTSSVCKKLEQLGYTKRERNKQDERIVSIMLTKEGIKLAKKIGNKFEKMMKLVHNYEKDKIDSIINGMEELNELLNYIIEKEGENVC